MKAVFSVLMILLLLNPFVDNGGRAMRYEKTASSCCKKGAIKACHRQKKKAAEQPCSSCIRCVLLSSFVIPRETVLIPASPVFVSDYRPLVESRIEGVSTSVWRPPAVQVV